MDDNVLILTNHAVHRIRQRMGVSKRAAERIAMKAWTEGITHSETTNYKHLNRWVTKQYFWNRQANQIRLWGDKAFLFSGTTLMTVIQIPHNLLGYVQDIMESKSQTEEE